MLMPEQNLFKPEDESVPIEQDQPEINTDSIVWTASEFIDNSKNFGWYLLFFVGILGISTVVFIFTHNIISSVVIFILGFMVCFMATRKPKEVDYVLDDQGIVINNIDYPFSDFKSYHLASEGGLEHISLVSVKRFSPGKTIYFEPQDKDHIISLLSQFLPLEHPSDDPVDRFAKKIGL